MKNIHSKQMVDEMQSEFDRGMKEFVFSLLAIGTFVLTMVVLNLSVLSTFKFIMIGVLVWLYGIFCIVIGNNLKRK